MEKQDIREYSSQELSMIVMNDEGLYKEFRRAVRRDKFGEFLELLDEYFIYDDDQEEALREDFIAELEEDQ